MNTRIKRIAAAAALLAVVALSGCGTIDNRSWELTPNLEKLPGDSLGYRFEPAATDVA